MKNLQQYILLLSLCMGFATAHAYDCISLTSATSVSCWGSSAYIPFPQEVKCWDINLNTNKPIQFTYTIDLETMNASDAFAIYSADANGNKKNMVYSISIGSATGTVTTNLPTGRAIVEFWSVSANKGGAMGVKFSFQAATDVEVWDGDLLVEGKVGIGVTQPKSTLHINGGVRGNGGHFKIESDMGSVTILPRQYYTDFTTSGSYFTFNKPICSTIGIFAVDNFRYDLQFQTYNDSTRMTILRTNGNVGIGTTTPQERLHVNGYLRGNGTNGAVRIRTTTGTTEIGSTNSTYSHFMTDRSMFYFSKPLMINSGKISSYYSQNLTFSTSNTTRMVILNSNGNVGIGTAAPAYKLDVNGSIRAKDIFVNTTTGADFVFDDDYHLRPLHEVNAFIQTNKHLPEIPSATDMVENGVNVNELQIQLLQKIEELTLYLIQQEQTIEELRQEIELLKKSKKI